MDQYNQELQQIVNMLVTENAKLKDRKKERDSQLLKMEERLKSFQEKN